MRKNNKKLWLKSERIRTLSDAEMGQVAGGLFRTPPVAASIAVVPTTTVYHHTQGCSATTAINCGSGGPTTTAPNCGSGPATTAITCPR